MRRLQRDWQQGLSADRRSVLAGGVALATTLIVGLPGTANAKEKVPLPKFTGPIPVRADSVPWGTAMDGGAREALVKHHGYLEEEYFLSGTANVYGPGNKAGARPGASPLEFADEMRPLAALVRSDVPYTTRALMLRPKDLGTFSGNAHLIPFHNLISLASVERNLLRNGDVWIGLEVNGGTRFGVEERPSGGIAHLKGFNARRYAELSIPAGQPSDWPDLQPGRLGEAFKTINFGKRDGDHNIFRQEISRSYAQGPDIMTQAAALLRSGGPTSPLAGHKVRRIFTNGASGQSTILAPYIDFHHEAALKLLGHVPFDGYMIRVGAMPVHRPTKSILVLVQSEAEVVDIKPPQLAKLTDSDDPMFRYYEIPGVGHGLSARPNVAERTSQVVPAGVQGLSDVAGPSEYEPLDKITLPVIWGMWRNAYDWLEKGVPMPRAPRVTRDAKASDGIARDRFDNALGGIRLPWMDVPDARYVGVISEKNPLEGGMKPFSESTMNELYGSRQAWQSKIDERLQQMVKDRLIGPKTRR